MSEDGSGGDGNFFTRLMSVFAINRYVGEGAMSGMGFNRAATWVAMISAITGGVIGLSTYRMDVNKQIDESVEKSFEMIQAYNSSDLSQARSRVMSYVYARRECDARYISRDLTDDDYVRVLEFYDLVHLCVDILFFFISLSRTLLQSKILTQSSHTRSSGFENNVCERNNVGLWC